MSAPITFCATGKTGLGHLRRVTNIAAALAARAPHRPLALLTNAALGGLDDDEARLYRAIASEPRDEMARSLRTRGCALAVVDTAVLPDLHELDAPLCLVLRETVPDRLARFRLERGRPWDLVLIPNPAAHWMPAPGTVPARRVEAAGWIYRDGGAAPGARGTTRSVLVASGGGGSGDTAAAFRERVGALLAAVRTGVREPVEIVQALGPRAGEDARVPGVDTVIRPGARLHECFAAHDVVISTAGYNSVLELACTDVPTLLLPVERTYDDQDKRTREWGAVLGLDHRDDDPGRTVRWMSRVLAARERRAPAPLGPSGAGRCAELIEGLLG